MPTSDGSPNKRASRNSRNTRQSRHSRASHRSRDSYDDDITRAGSSLEAEGIVGQQHQKIVRRPPPSSLCVAIIGISTVGAGVAAYQLGLATCAGHVTGRGYWRMVAHKPRSANEEVTSQQRREREVDEHELATNVHSLEADRVPLDERLSTCLREVPGWFAGGAVYQAAAREIAGRMPSLGATATAGTRAPIFVEVGSYLGQSTCYLSWLLRGTSGRIDIVDQWGSIDARHLAALVAANASTTTNTTSTPGVHDEVLQRVILDSPRVLAAGKGQFMLSFAHYVQTVGYWPAVRHVIHGNVKDGSADGPVAHYDNASLSFVYIDRCRRGRHAEMALFWPRMRTGGIMCGDDVRAKGVRHQLNQFFSKYVPTVLRLPKVKWRATRESRDHWCATRQY